MNITFYDKDFNAIANNSSLIASRDTFSLIRRPIEMDTLYCKCRAFKVDVNPTFLVVEDKEGHYVYGCLAGVPLLDKNNQAEINGTDLKSILSSDIWFGWDFAGKQPYWLNLGYYIRYIVKTWAEQVNKGTEVEFGLQYDGIFNIDLNIDEEVFLIEAGVNDLKFLKEPQVINAYNELSTIMKYYDVYLETKLDDINKKIIFNFHKLANKQVRNVNIKLEEYGVLNYGKYVAEVNEAQGIYHNKDTGQWTVGQKWILTKNNAITIDDTNRDLYPVKLRLLTSDKSIEDANYQSLTTLLQARYNEDIVISADDYLRNYDSDDENENGGALLGSNFKIYYNNAFYKDLPCGELRYNSTGLVEVQIGFRYTGLEFI